jgi:hypothetical protein
MERAPVMPVADETAQLLRQVQELRANVRALEQEHLDLDGRFQAQETRCDQLKPRIADLERQRAKLRDQVGAARFRIAERLARVAALVPGLLPLLRRLYH